MIALVITIIVLLILAGVSIATLTGENGILTQAENARKENKVSGEEEKVKLSATGAVARNNGGKITREFLNMELASYIGIEGEDYTLSESETAPFTVTYLESGRSYVIDEKGNVSVDIATYVKEGDYVNYNPTVSDKAGTQVIDENKLTYSSPTGNGMTHGNGYVSSETDGGQTFTATDDIKWRVLKVENGKIELISENSITADSGANLTLSGVTGYLYAEQELNEICKIYGYGYGADTSQVIEYSYGGPLDGDLKGTITGSGARSITIDDINEKTGVYEDEDGTMKCDKEQTKLSTHAYGDNYPAYYIYYPTISTENGVSTEAGAKDLKITDYYYDNPVVDNDDIKDLLLNEAYNNEYFLSSRSFGESSVYPVFSVGTVSLVWEGIRVSKETFLCYQRAGNEYRGYEVNGGIRPIVTINADNLDIDSNTEYNGKTMWNLK